MCFAETWCVDNIVLKCGHTMQFSSHFQSPQVSRLLRLSRDAIFTIDFWLIKIIQYFLYVGKSKCEVMILTWESIEIRTHIRFSIDFQTLIRLSTKMVTQYDISRKQIGFKKLDGKSDEKSHRVTALIIQSLYV